MTNRRVCLALGAWWFLGPVGWTGEPRLRVDLDDAWEVLGEAVQTVLRAAGVPDGYELLKEFTRGRRIDAKLHREFIAGLPLPSAERERLAALQPADYIGLAARLTRQA